MASTHFQIRELVESGQLPDLIPDLISHLESSPEDAESWVLLAAARFESNSPKAEATLQKAFEIQPDLAIAWAEKGRWLMRKGQWEEADRVFSQALALGTPDSEILAYRGMVRRRLGFHEAAIKDFEAATSISFRQEEAEWHLRMYKEQEEARASGSWVTIESHFDPEWLLLMKNLLLEEGIPTKISRQQKEVALSSSTMHFNRKLQVPIEHSEKAYWTIFDWAMNHHYYQFAEQERGEDSDENIETIGSKLVPSIGIGIGILLLLGFLLILLLKA